MAQILVIDDEESIRFTFEYFLRGAGHEVACASSFSEGLARIAEQEWDVIFSDILLEGHNGLDMLRERAGQDLKCPVVMITGYPTVETASDAVRLGAFDYIAKPVELEALLRVTNLALKQKKKADGERAQRSCLDAIVRTTADAIITVNQNFILTHVNQAAQKLCGLNHDAIGKDFRALDAACSAKLLPGLTETIQNKETCRAKRLEFRHKGDATIVNVTCQPLLDDGGQFAGAVLVLRPEARAIKLPSERPEPARLAKIIGKSRPIQKVCALIESLAQVDSTVLVTGESGTGKELVADALHELGPRRNKPLVKVNCAALSDTLLISELFGHVRGAFTGALNDRIGRFQKAHGGTIFLDEIGDLSAKMQAALLRVLQEKQIERVGDSTSIKVDVRVVAATNRDLDGMTRLGQFRADLLYRLRVVDVVLPPLRERREDIALLMNHFLAELNRRKNRGINGVSADVMNLFLGYSWPGNIRELQHALEHAFVLCDQDTISVDHLPVAIKAALNGLRTPLGPQESMRQAIIRALQRTAWNKKRAALLLAIDRKTLYRNIAKYNIAMQAEDNTEAAVPVAPLGT